MKKNFSQIFRSAPMHTSLIVRDSVSRQFLVYTSIEEHEEDFCHILSLELSTKQQTSIQLAKYLYSRGLVLNSYRRVSEKIDVSFSFVDKTPGVEATSICVLVDVDVADSAKLDETYATASFVSIYDLLDKLSAGPGYDASVELGIAQIISELSVLRGYNPTNRTSIT